MSRFTHRSYQKELLDRDDIPVEDIRRNLEELDVINTRLGGHKLTLDALDFILKKLPAGKSWHIVEIGCGGGDNLAAILRWANQKKIPVQLTGIDSNSDCVAFSENQHSNIAFINNDYRKVMFPSKPDVIFSALFCHHFTDDELIQQLQWMHANSATGFFINDLHRHPLAFFSIKALTRFFSKSYLVKNDAPLSVLRGFKRKEWLDLFSNAGVQPTRLCWKWAFRWQIIVCKNHADS